MAGPRVSTGSQRQSRPHRVTERRIPLKGEDGGTKVVKSQYYKDRITRTEERRTGRPRGGSQRTIRTRNIYTPPPPETASAPVQSTATPANTPTTAQTPARTPARPSGRGPGPGVWMRDSAGQLRSYGPTQVGEKASASVGLLEVEFIAAEVIIFIEMFTGTDTYGNKVMFAMKRGMFTAILFFILAIIAGIGPNAGKISKGLGALVIMAVLLSSPAANMIALLDDFFKGDWTGTNESGPVSSANQNSANPSTNTSPNIPADAGAIVSALDKKLGIVGSFAAETGEEVSEGYAISRLVAALSTGNLKAAKNAADSIGDKGKSIVTDVLGSFGIHL